MSFVLGGRPLTLAELRSIALVGPVLALAPEGRAAVAASARTVETIAASGKPAYGINTGFGRLSQTRIPPQELEQLQKNIVLSHAAGVGAPLGDEIVRLVLALKTASLARGASGVRVETVEALLRLYNERLYPRIPAQGSVGASGDLAPLAHLALALMGIGEVRLPDPLRLAPKEGLALLNGTQVSTALALAGLFAIENVFAAATAAGALSVDAGQSAIAACYQSLLEGSEIRRSHLENDPRVQDPYSLRCQPQVMGACLEQMRYAARILEIEANGVTDNPLVFADTGEVLSGGNFHAEPVALVSDALAVAIAEIGALSERRIALLIDASLSGLPPFLVEHGGVNSGFMVPQVTAAALASENKSLAHPASVDSLPTSANQEDHVSMATFAARRLSDMARNSAGIVAIELLAAAQGIDFRAPLRTSPTLQQVHALVRSRVAFYDHDRYFAPDIEAIRELVESGAFRRFVPGLLPSG